MTREGEGKKLRVHIQSALLWLSQKRMLLHSVFFFSEKKSRRTAFQKNHYQMPRIQEKKAELTRMRKSAGKPWSKRDLFTLIEREQRSLSPPTPSPTTPSRACGSVVVEEGARGVANV